MGNPNRFCTKCGAPVDIDDLFCIEDALEWVQNEYSPSDIVDCKMDWSNR